MQIPQLWRALSYRGQNSSSSSLTCTGGVLLPEVHSRTSFVVQRVFDIQNVHKTQRPVVHDNENVYTMQTVVVSSVCTCVVFTVYEENIRHNHDRCRERNYDHCRYCITCGCVTFSKGPLFFVKVTQR